MKRKIIKNLLEWKKNNSEMPYMLVGARQVGKTFILDEFCRNNYKEYLYFNLEEEKEIREVFEIQTEGKGIELKLEYLTSFGKGYGLTVESD